MKKTLFLILKLIALTVLFFILYMAGSVLLGPTLAHEDPAMQMAALRAIPIVCLVDTLVLALVILRSSWNGWKLMLATSFSYYGVQTVMAQIESAYFGPALGISATMVKGLFLQSLPIVLIYIPLAVLILAKGRGRHSDAEADAAAAQRLSMPVGQWAWKLAVIAVVYVVLYFTFGYFVAWANPALSAMYGNGADKQIFDLGRLLTLQLGRGILWALFTLPLIRMTKGSPWQIALIAGLLLALPMNISHVIPNPIMPDPSVRLSHFIETATSNFIFGIVITQLVLWRPRPAHAPSALPAQKVTKTT
jgi:hypothetical protein